MWRLKITLSSFTRVSKLVMYQQKDGVAMGSPLGPALANIFVGFHEERLFNYDQKPGVYYRYVDDTMTHIPFLKQR